MKLLKFFTLMVLCCFLNSTYAQIDIDFPQPDNEPANILCGEHKIIYGVPYKNIKFCGTKEEANAFRRVLAVFLNRFYKAFPGFFKSMFVCDNEECPDVTCVQHVHVYKVSVTIPYYIGGGCYRLQIKPRIRATCSDCEDGVKPIIDDPHEVTCGEYGSFEQTLASTTYIEGQDIEGMIDMLYEYYNYFPEDLNAFVSCQGNCSEEEQCESEVGLGGIGYEISEGKDGSATISFISEIEAECSSCQSIHSESHSIGRGLNETKDVYIHPNPSNGLFTIDLSNSMEMTNRRIEIYNLQGQLIFNKKLDKNATKEFSIDLTKAENGVYFLFLKSDHSKHVIKKLIVE